MKKVIIVGYQGQDGRHLWDLCKKKNFSIIGIGKKKIKCYKVIYKDTIDIQKINNVKNLISFFKPDYIFFVAAYHHSSEEEIVNLKSLYQKSYNINCLSYINFLDSVDKFSSKSKIFYASSAHVFGQSNYKTSIDESFTYKPNSIYGITKLNSMNIGNYFKDNRGLFVSNGILFGHESVYRHKKFVSKKIVSTAVEIFFGKSKKLFIGNLDALVDWGYAGDFVSAYLKILEYKKPDDFIIGTGKTSTVRKFIKLVFNELKIDWKKYVIENNKIIKRNPYYISANYNKLKKATGWTPKYDIEALAKKLVYDEINLYNKR